MDNFFSLFILFMIYSFLGYLVEIIICSLDEKRLVINRGFLFGPYLPIFGTGSILLVSLLSKYKKDYIIIFLMGMMVCSAIEYLTGWILEKWFHNKWWDYSGHKDNINGRITLTNSVAFGLGAIVIVKYLNPLLKTFINYFSNTTIIILGIILLIMFLIDEFYSIVIAYALRSRIIIVEELKASKKAMVPETIKKYTKEKMTKFRASSDRLIKSFPKLINYKEIMLVKEIMIEMKNETKKQRKKKQ